MTGLVPHAGLVREASVTVEAVTSLEGIAALGPSYDRLCRLTGNTLPFALHEWHVAWCRHFLNANPRIRDEPLFYVVRDLAGVCVAIIPFIVSRRRVGPLKVVSVNFIGADPAISEIRTPLIDPRYEVLTARAVKHQLQLAGEWDWIHWSGVSDAFANALAIDGGTHRYEVESDYVLDLPATWEQFRAGLKRNIRESLRHCYNSLKRDNLAFEFEVCMEGEELRRGIDRFFALHAMRAEYKTSVVHANRFASPISRNFIHEVCERLSKRGAVRLFQLKISGTVVAARLGFVVGDSLYLYYSGYDPKWSRYSVMTTTMAEAIKHAIASGFNTVNLSPTKDLAKTRWGPRQVDYRSVYQQGGRLRSRMAHQAYVKVRASAGIQNWFLLHLLPARRHW